MNEQGQIFHELRQDYYKNFYFQQELLNDYSSINVVPIGDGDNMEEITAITFLTIEARPYVLLAFKKSDDRQSVLKLATLPMLTLKKEVFAEVPQLITCMKLSQDQKYLAVGCIDG